MSIWVKLYYINELAPQHDFSSFSLILILIRLQVKHSLTEGLKSKRFLDLEGRQMLPLQGHNYTLYASLMPSAFLFSFSHMFSVPLLVCCLCFRGWFQLLQLLFLLQVHDHRQTHPGPRAKRSHCPHWLPTALLQTPHSIYAAFTSVCVLHSGLMKPQTLQTSHEDPSRSGYA